MYILYVYIYIYIYICYIERYYYYIFNACMTPGTLNMSTEKGRITVVGAAISILAIFYPPLK